MTRRYTGWVLGLLLTTAHGYGDAYRLIPGGNDGTALLRPCRAYLWLLEEIQTGRNDKAPRTTFNDAFYCHGLASGIITMNTAYQVEFPRRVPLFCIPTAVQGEQGARVIVRYLDTHPNMLHLPGATLVIYALRDAFPCAPAAAPLPPSAPKAGKGKQ